MPTVFTHAVVAGSLGQTGQAKWRSDWRFWYAAVLCSVLPDVDVLGFRIGIHYGDFWGHRGMTHSLLFAAIIGIVMGFRFKAPARQRWKLILLLFIITASHGLLDAMTNGGLGIAFFSPFNNERYFLPWTPIQVSPIGAGHFFSARGLSVIASEIVWVWIPALVFAAVVWAVKNRGVGNRPQSTGDRKSAISD